MRLSSRDPGASDITPERVQAGISLYSSHFLSVYDWLVLGLSCRFIWQCTAGHLLDLYNRHASANHLDIGVGTGYFLDRCRFPSANPRLALMDLNPNSLRMAAKRVARYGPETYLWSALEPLRLQPAFDSVGMVNLLHCLPGNIGTKDVVFRNVTEVMNPGAVLFGSTFLGKGVEHSPLARIALRMTNSLRFMTNLKDDLNGLRTNLHRHFRESEVRVIGSEALFWARL